MYQNITPSKDVHVAVFFQRVYAWMFLGLLISAGTALFTVSSESLLMLILGNKMVFYGLLLFELALVFILAGMIKHISPMLAMVMFVLYSFVTGLTLSVIVLAYTLTSIAYVFFITAGMFGTMSVYGAFTKKDLSSMGSILIMGLIGIILAGVLNIFLIKSSLLDLGIAALGVLIFTGLTAYDTQKIKRIYLESRGDVQKLAIVGALSLYLDFINLFLSLLRLLGNRRD